MLSAVALPEPAPNPAPTSWRTRLCEGVVLTVRPGLVGIARYGLAVKGVLQLLVGCLALGAALGDPQARLTDAPGALLALARQPFGKPILLLLTLGLFAYAGFRVVQGVFDPLRRRLTAGVAFFRVADVVSGIGYGLLAVGAGRLFLGLRHVSSDARSRQLTAEALALPYGPKMLLAFAAVLVALTLLFLARAFLVRDVCGDLVIDALGERACRTIAFLIRFASVVQATLFFTMATVFYRVALVHDARAARGMAGVLRLIGARQGAVVLGLIALGFIAMAATSFIEARWRKELTFGPARC